MTQTYSLSPWSLSDLFPSLDSSEMKAAFDGLEAEVEQFEITASAAYIRHIQRGLYANRKGI